MKESVTSDGLQKFLRVFPIFGLLFYYIGGLITSLDVSESTVFIIQIVGFSIILLIGLFVLDSRLVIVGVVLAVMGTAWSIHYLIQSLSQGLIGFSTVGGGFSIVADFFFAMSLYTWFRVLHRR